VVKDDNLGEEREPLLVRPYLLHDSGTAPADDESSQTWPAATTREVSGQRALGGLDEPTAVLALPAAPERRHARPARRRLVLLSVVGAVVALVVGVAGLTALRTGAPPASALQAEPLPAATGPQPASAQASGSNGESTTTTAATPTTAAGGGRSTSATRGPGKAPTTKANTAGSGQTTVKPAVPAGQQAPTPASDRTGAIRGQNGVCLDGSVPFDRDHVQVSRCDGSGAQTFTLATDGTLRVDGKCAEVDGDGSVQTGDCGGRDTAKWRTDGQLLIDTESGRCLTDPFGGGVHIGTRVMVLPCGGSARQRWSLP
jgi:hypothetical protein